MSGNMRIFSIKREKRITNNTNNGEIINLKNKKIYCKNDKKAKKHKKDRIFLKMYYNVKVEVFRKTFFWNASLRMNDYEEIEGLFC